MAKKTTKKKTKPAQTGSGTRIEPTDIDSPQFWRGVALAFMGDVKEIDDWKVMEYATLLHLQSGLIREHFKEADKIAEKQGGVKLTFVMSTDRGVTPPTIMVNATCGQRPLKWKAKSDCPDPNAMDLPGLSREEVAAEQSKEEDTAGKEENQGTGNPPF